MSSDRGPANPNGLTCECGHHVSSHLWSYAVGDPASPPSVGCADICPCREFKSAEVGRLRVMVAERDRGHAAAIEEWKNAEAARLAARDAQAQGREELAALKAENAKLSEENGQLRNIIDTSVWICGVCGKDSFAHTLGQVAKDCVYEPVLKPTSDFASLRARLEAADEQYSELSDEAHELRTKLAARDGLIERAIVALKFIHDVEIGCGECPSCIRDGPEIPCPLMVDLETARAGR